MFRNSEGISLLTGAPSQRSLRLWLNYNWDSNHVRRRSFLSSAEPLRSLDPPSHQDAQRTLPINHSSNDSDQVRVNVDVINLNSKGSSARSSFTIEGLNIRKVSCTSLGEVFAQLEDGRVKFLGLAGKTHGVELSDDMTLRLFGNATTKEMSNSSLGSVLELETNNMLNLDEGEKWFWVVPRFRALTPVEQISCGRSHMCCVTDAASGRRLFGWGNNAFGQCGQQPTKHNKYISKPLSVSGIEDVVLLSCGPDYTCCVSSSGDGFNVHSFGGGVTQGRLSGLFKSHVFQEASVPHAEISISNYFSSKPLLVIKPGAEDSTLKPMRFWSPSLSDWVEKVDEEWLATASYPPSRLDSSSGTDGFEFAVEIENSRSRLTRMRRALASKVSKCVTTVTASEWFEDPAPFEIEKLLTNVEMEIKANQEQQDMEGTNEDASFLKDEEKRLLEIKDVYDHLKSIWERPPQIPANRTCDREVLYALLDDCRRSEMSYLVNELNLRLQKSRGKSDLGSHHVNVSIFDLIGMSEAVLGDVKRGLDAFEAKTDLKDLYDAVAGLHAKKVATLAVIKKQVSSMLETEVTCLETMRNRVLQENSSRFDLSSIMTL